MQLIMTRIQWRQHNYTLLHSTHGEQLVSHGHTLPMTHCGKGGRSKSEEEEEGGSSDS